MKSTSSSDQKRGKSLGSKKRTTRNVDAFVADAYFTASCRAATQESQFDRTDKLVRFLCVDNGFDSGPTDQSTMVGATFLLWNIDVEGCD